MTDQSRPPAVTVLMPTYGQAEFIARALESLLAQRLPDWELIIIDDGSPDNTGQAVQPFLADPRIRYHRFEENRGLGAVLNFGLERARGGFIAYLPSDDIFYQDHLESLHRTLQANPGAVLAFSGLRHHYNRSAAGQLEGYPLQLVQVMHKAGPQRWTERAELESDDLERLFWSRLRPQGDFVYSGQLTCEWVDHPHQRHKIMQEPVGGINPFRQYYNVGQPLRFHTTMGNFIDEVARYQVFRERPDTPMAPDGLKILLVGELAYNADRVLALEERGHKLYGLWMRQPYWYNAVGPLPFGHVEDLPFENWQKAVREVQPDVIYALLNWQAVPLAHAVMKEFPAIPFVWHFKEGPFICLEKGTWRELVELHTLSDGRIYSSPEMLEWYETVVPGSVTPETSLALDGDLPKRDWFQAERSPRLSEKDGQIHTVVPGRPIGLHPHTVAELAARQIHLHFYGDFTHGQWRAWIEKARSMAGDFLHLHSQVDQENWVREFSQYDAGWLHFFKSENNGELRRSNWDDLNYPARMATLAVAGLPMLQGDNSGAIVATQALVKKMDLGLFFSNMEELAARLKDADRLDQLRESVWRQREHFMFDSHADTLVEFFRQVIARGAHRRTRTS